MTEEQSMIGRTLGDFEILALLGAGGMGEVYRARDNRLGREVAIKILPSLLAERAEARARFEREAKAVAALSHPNILSIYQFGSEDGLAYAVTELLNGETLRARLKQSALPWKQAVEIGASIAEGLAAAHTKEIVHRDLKPENIFLTSEEQVKILDFGIARLGPAPAERISTAEKRSLAVLATESAAAKTVPGTVMGTRGYMSPEQIRGEVANSPSDIFSLGCILYEMLVGKGPFARATVAETLLATLNEDPPPLPLTSAEIPGELEALIRECLRKEPADRFPSAKELAAKLRSVVSGQASKGRARSPRAAWAAAALAGLLLGAGSWWYFRSHQRSMALDSLAVLPLDNFSRDPQQEYFADGMTEELIANLAKIRSLRVISRTSVMKYKGTRKPLPEIARELNVAAVVEGSVRREGNRVRISAQLIDAAAEKHLWAESYERDFQDVLALQSDVARAVAKEIKVLLTPEEEKRLGTTRQVNSQAYEAYLKGVHYWNKDGLEGAKKSIEYFEQAIEIDSNYAPAYARLALSHNLFAALQHDVPQKEIYPKAETAAIKALELDPMLGEPHAALGVVRWKHDWSWAGAEKEFKRALELEPNSSAAHHVYGSNLDLVGRFDEAVIELKRAEELDPLAIINMATLGSAYMRAGQHALASKEFLKGLEINPNSSELHRYLGRNYVQQGKYDEAIREYEKASELEGRKYRIDPFLYAAMGKRDEALKGLAEMEKESQQRYVVPTDIAEIYARLGEKDKAFEWLEKAYQNHDRSCVFFKVGPRLEPLRSDPRFQDLLRRIGFPP